MSQVASTPGVARLPRGAAGRRLAAFRAHLRGFRLDVALAHGSDPWSTAELMIRASRLSSLSERQRLAAGLAALVSLAEDRRQVSPYVRVRHQVVLEQRESLLALAERLGQLEPIAIPIVAQIAVLLSDPWSPAYQGGEDPRRLAQVTIHCLEAAR
jgi:hypothetical protein